MYIISSTGGEKEGQQLGNLTQGKQRQFSFLAQ